MGTSGSSGNNAPGGDFDRTAYYAGGTNTVQLAYSPLGGLPGFSAYHTSVIVNGEEFFFDEAGIETTPDVSSHKMIAMQNGQQSTQTANNQSTMLDQGNANPGTFYRVEDFGMSNKTGYQLKTELTKYFEQGTYDLLKKNCNSFSDVAIFFLTGKRINSSYRKLEKMGQQYQAMVAQASGGRYQPNPRSQTFDVEQVIAAIDPAKRWLTPGRTLQEEGAPPAQQLTADEIRRKRLEALDKK